MSFSIDLILTLILELLVFFAELCLRDSGHHKLLLLLTYGAVRVPCLYHVLELIEFLSDHLKMVRYLLLLLVVIFIAHFKWVLFKLMFATQ